MKQFGEKAGGFKFGKQRPRSLGDPQGKLPDRGATTWFVLRSWPVGTGSSFGEGEVAVCYWWWWWLVG